MIGVFDSGFGGLTVLKALLHKLPEYDYLYLGDNARTPYGNRSTETLIEFSEAAVDYLFVQGCSFIILACNTLSSSVLRHLQEKYLRQPGVTDRKILGVIKPLAEVAAERTQNLKIGVVGTRSTIQAKSYEIELLKIDPELKVYEQACPLLVPLIEEHWHRRPETRMILRKYLRPLKSAGIDTLILGCTHYPILAKDFSRMMGPNVEVLDSGEIIAESTFHYLERHPEIEQKLSRKKQRIFLTTDDPKRFQVMGQELLGQPLPNVQKIKL